MTSRYNPWFDAQERYPAVHIEWHAIAPAQAVWSPAHQVILVDENISRAERRCALAHELAHMDTGDLPTEMCWFAARQETNADRLAARRLIAVDELAETVRWCRDPREVAAELEVTLGVLSMRWRWMHPTERGVVLRTILRRETAA